MFVAAAKRSFLSQQRLALIRPSASSHTLTVPYAHLGITSFENGVPVDQVRELHPVEKNWDFWTSSDAFLAVKPTLGGYSRVPYGEVWVLNGGKVVPEGNHFLSPFAKVLAVKNTHPISMGVVSPPLTSKDGVSVNAYAVVHIKITDAVKSATYVDPETNKSDSERAVARMAKKILENTVSTLTLGDAVTLSVSDAKLISDKILTAVSEKAGAFGLEVLSVEMRGTFPVSDRIAEKLRALDPPLMLPTQTGHNLANDYWAEVLSPPFFSKFKFGSEKEVVTPAAVSLEWSIPSPPDYHHFNEVPRQIAEEPVADGKLAKAH